MDGDEQGNAGSGELADAGLELGSIDSMEGPVGNEALSSGNEDLEKMTSLIDGGNDDLLGAGDGLESTLEPSLEATLEPSLEPSLEPIPEPSPAPQASTASPIPAASLNPLGGNVMSIKKIQGIKVQVQVMLGSISLSVSQLASLKEGELISLDSSIGDPIEVLANGQLIARGEIVVIEGDNPTFGVTLTEIVDADISA